MKDAVRYGGRGLVKVNHVDICANNVAGKPNSLVLVVLEKCVDLPAMINNESSNPYVEVKSRGKRYKTQVIKETLEPLFQERIPGVCSLRVPMPAICCTPVENRNTIACDAGAESERCTQITLCGSPAANTAPPARCCN